MKYICMKLIFSKVFNLSTERERIQREKLRDLAVFERLNGNPGKSSPALAVKKVRLACSLIVSGFTLLSTLVSTLGRIYCQESC